MNLRARAPARLAVVDQVGDPADRVDDRVVVARAAQPPDVGELEEAEESESLPSQTGTKYRTASEGRTM